MTSNSLNGLWYSTSCLIHCRCSLPACSCCSLRVKVLLLRVLCLGHLIWGLLHHAHLMAIAACLRRVRWRCTLLMRTIHVVVHWWGLTEGALTVLAHMHICGVGVLCGGLCLCLGLRLGLSLRLGLGLSCLSSLLADCFGLLLLLYPRSG